MFSGREQSERQEAILLLDQSCFPWVFLRADARSDQSDEVQIDALLDRGMPFVLIRRHEPHEHDGDSPEERKQHALLFKRIKVRLQALCRGMIVVEEDDIRRMAASFAAKAAGKALGVPIHFVRNEAEGLALGAELMAPELCHVPGAGTASERPEDGMAPWTRS